jgi:DNA ligase-associated metallophosphoesterase
MTCLGTSFDLDIGADRWRLLPSGAALHLRSGALVVADVHLGKAATFRARGVPVPQGSTSENLRRLDELVAAHAVRTLVFLGDLFHAREAHAPDTIACVAQWRARQRSLRLVLVEGNHDRSAGPPPPDLDIEVVDEPWFLGAAALCHEPQPIADAIVIAGHLHPVIRLHGRADDSVRLPCFWLRPGLWILPAFGDFTGGARFERAPGDRVIAAGEGRLYEIPPARSLAA